MAHTHHCKTCGVAVGMCAGDCAGSDNDYCTLHHPAPEHRKELVQPSKRTVVTLPDAKV